MKFPIHPKLEVIQIDPLTNMAYVDSLVQHMGLVGDGIYTASNSTNNSNRRVDSGVFSIESMGLFKTRYRSSYGDAFIDHGATPVINPHCWTKWSHQHHLQNPYLLMNI